MIRRIILAAFYIASLGLISPNGVAYGDEAVMVITEDYPPLNYLEDNVLKGPSVEIVRLIKARLGDVSPIKTYPWARGYKYLETRKNTALFSTTRSQKREPLFKWVGPLAEKKIGLFAKKGRGIKLGSLEDAKAYVIGVQRQGHGMQYLQERGFKMFDQSTTAAANLKKLMLGRNDLWFASNATLVGNAGRLKVNVSDFELVLEVDNTFMSIAFHKETPDGTIKRWQAAYDALVKEGVVKEIFKKHGLETLYPTGFEK